MGIAIGLWGCVTDQQPVNIAKSDIDHGALAGGLLEKIFSTYQNYNREDFSGLVCRDFVPDAFAFVNSSEDGFNAVRFVEMRYFLEKALFDKDNKLLVDFKWDRKTIARNSNTVNLTEGRAQFVFRKERAQWLLYQTSGDDPFK